MPQRDKTYEREMKCTLRELPYFNVRADIVIHHGCFNNSLLCYKKTKRSLESLPSLYDLDLFSLNSVVDDNLSNIDSFPFINSRYYSPCSFQKIKSSEHDLSKY